ncbi:MAG: serine hydrolase [Gemmatimonadota bacterium]
MSAARLATIDRVVRRGMTAGGYPGASVVIGRRGAAVLQKGYGHLGWTGDSPGVDADRTIYDLASLSKVIGTTTGAMILYDEGRLDLDAPVSRYIPEFRGGDKDLVTVRHLLTHRSGLPAGRELWRTASNAMDARHIVLSTPLANKPGAVFVYSDLGADVLAWVVEAVSGLSLDTYLAERVFKPLGMNDTFYNPPDSVRYRVAPTEVAPPRGYPLKGEVHDENAFALGGVAGHAGLFSTASDLAIFAQMMLNGGEYNDVRIFSDSTVATFTRRSSGTRALGWDTADGDGGSGEYLTAAAFGHTGYTGTSIWIDPEREMFVVLLTNRVHAARARRPAKVIADVRADLADAAALSVEDTDRILAMPASFRADRADGWNKAVRTRRVSRSKARPQTRAKATSKSSKAKSSRSSTASKTPTKKKATATKAKPAAAKSSSKARTPTKARAVKAKTPPRKVPARSPSSA